MAIDLPRLLRERATENMTLHHEHINPQLAKVLKTIGFDKSYVRAEGAYLYDHQDRKYIDFLAGYGVYNSGRNHPVIRDTLKQYLDCNAASLIQIGAPLLSGILAEELKQRVPKQLDTVYFTSAGAEGVETAIKFAHCATGRPRILYYRNAFHGLTNGALSLNGAAWFREGFEPLLPKCEAITFNDLDNLETELNKGDVAGLMIEPIQGKTLHVATDDYMQKAKALCQQHGTLFICDEVQTGLGRTGRLFAYEHSGAEPDILIMSKALSGGYVPVGAVMTRRDVYDKVFNSKERCVVHSSTFGQGDFAMAAGLASLHVLEDEGYIENAAKMGELLKSKLTEVQQEFETIKDVRGRGLMIGIEFARPKSFKQKMGWDLANKLYPGLFTQAIVISLFKDFGILTQVSGKDVDIIKLIPPLVINEQDVNYFVDSFRQVMQRSKKFPGPIWDLTTQLAKQTLKRKQS